MRSVLVCPFIHYIGRLDSIICMKLPTYYKYLERKTARKDLTDYINDISVQLRKMEIRIQMLR